MAEKKQLNYNPAAVREELMRMLDELSYDALQYVWRPILYAYQYTDNNDPDALTDDDMNRFHLIGAAAHGSPKHVVTVSDYSRCVYSNSRKAKTRS